MKKGILFITLSVLLTLILPISTSSSAESTSSSIDHISSKKTFNDEPIEMQEKIQSLVQSIYEQNQKEAPVLLSEIENLIGSANQIETGSESIDYHLYHLVDHAGFTIDLTLAISNKEQEVVEAIATVNPPNPKSETTSTIKLDDIHEAGNTLKEIYQNKETARLDDLTVQWKQPQKISYIYDLTIYHYLGESPAEQIALTLSNDTILAVNYQNKTEDLLAQPLSISKRELDQISHTAGVKWQEMTNRFGNPMGINYNSEKGIITLSWHSEAEDSVSDVYYYMAYNGIGIGVQYH